MKKLITLLIVMLLGAGSSWAGDVNLYTFASTSGTYTALATETVLWSATFDDNNSTAITIPAFTVNGTPYTTMFVQANGWITLGGTTIASSYTPISQTTSYPVVISAFGRDMNNAATGTPKISYNTNDGGDIVVQYQDVRRYNVTGEIFSVQIRLKPSGDIVFVYGGTITGGTSTSYPQVGLRGATNSIYTNRTTTTNWAATTAGTLNTNTCLMSTTVTPSAGLTFTFSPPAAGTPLPPTTPSPANAAVNVPVSGSVTWTFGANTTTYDLKFGPTGSMTQVVTGAAAGATGSYTYSGLNNSSFYQWQVIEHNGAITTSGPVWSFFTVCGTYSIPFTENFDSYTVPAVGCGTILDANADLVKWANSTSSPKSTPNNLHISYSAAGVTQDDWYFTPGLVLTNQSYDVKFYYKGGSSSYLESLEVKWGNAATAAGMTSPVMFSDLSFYKAAYTLAAFSFNPGASGTFYIGWHCISIGDQLGIDVDDITVIVTPACPAPLTVTASAITGTGASIGWTGTAPNVQIDYGTVGHTAGTGTLVSTSTNPQPISSLTPSTSYDVFVRRDCGSGVYSTWTGPVTFTTACAAVSAFNENFDAVTAPALPNCWKSYVSPSFSFETVLTYATGPNTAPNCVQLYSSGAALAADAPMLISPALTNLSAHTYQLRFNAKGASTNLSVIVGTMSDPANSATFVPFATVSGLNTTTYTSCIVSFAAYSGTNTYIAFQHPLTTTYSYIYIDDAVWEPLPACPQPISLSTTNITSTTALLDWTNGGSEIKWNIKYGAPGFDPLVAGTLISGITAHPYTLNPPLTPNTSYDWYVQADCGGSSTSNWTGPKNFKTTCLPIAGIPWFENFDAMPVIGNNILPDCWKAESATGTPWWSGNAASITYNDPCTTPNYVYVSYSPSATDKFLITPGFTLTAATSYDFKFNWIGDGYAGWTGDAMVNSAQTGTGATLLGTSFLVAGTTTTAVCTPAKRIFTPATTGTYYFMVRVNNTGTPWYLGFDGFSVELTPACSEPTNLTATSITQTTANLAWTPVGAATAWEYSYGVSPYGVPAGAGTPTTSSTVNPIGPLSSSTTYQYYVRASCGGSTYSVWAGPFTFSTLCGAVSVPYTQNFDAVTAPAIPNCMLVTDDNADAVKWLTSTSAPRSTPNSMRIGYNSAAAMNDWFFTPGLALTPGTYKVSFWYHSSGATYPEKLEVKWGTAQSAAGMTNGPIFTNNNIITASYVQGTGNMIVTAAGTYYVGWHGFSDADMYYIVVDDISITQALAHDVSAASINNIPAVYDPTPVTPKATVTNLGTNTETFTVTMTITGGYTSTKTVTALAPDASAEVTFNTWTPTLGAFTAQVCTNLGTDLNTSNDCKSVTGTVFNYTRFYSYIAFAGTASLPEGPGFFYKEAPGTVVSLAPTTSDQFISAGTWANGKWYGSEYYDNTAALPGGGWWTIDVDGTMTKSADLGRSFTGITYDHTTNIMYGVDYDDVALTNNLYTINKTTGAATLLGTVAAGELLINLATDGSGFLYSLGITTDHLFKINTVGTPVASDVGACGIDLNYGQDMEYDYASSTMYAAAYTTEGSLYTVSLTTGACTLVGAFAGGAELTGFAIPYTDSKTLNLTGVRLEGLYNGAGTMRQAADETGPHWPAGVADHITVELHSTTAYGLVTTFSNVPLSTTGTATIAVPATYSGTYRITVKHRNSIETTTAAAVSFAGSTISQSFAAPANVYGGNLGLTVDSYYVIYGGDVNQDGIIDTGDYEGVDNDAFNYAAGYLATDVNGDGAIDTGDFVSIDNNGFNYIGSILP